MFALASCSGDKDHQTQKSRPVALPVVLSSGNEESEFVSVDADGSALQRTPSKGDLSPDLVRIAYYGQTEVHIAKANGSDDQVIAKIEASDDLDNRIVDLIWSPDGRRLAFTNFVGRYKPSVVRPPDAVHIVSSDGKSELIVPLPGAALPGGLSWSPDGRWIAVTRLVGRPAGDSNGMHLIVIDSVKGQVYRDVPEGVGFAAWAPDGSKVAYGAQTRDRDPVRVDILELPTGIVTSVPLASDGTADYYPTWSPDSHSLAFIRSCPQSIIPLTTKSCSASRMIMQMNLEDSTPARLLSLSTGVRFPADLAWSPDGSRLAFVNADTTAAIYVFGRDGSGLQELVRAPAGFSIRDFKWTKNARLSFLIYKPFSLPVSESLQTRLLFCATDLCIDAQFLGQVTAISGDGRFDFSPRIDASATVGRTARFKNVSAKPYVVTCYRWFNVGTHVLGTPNNPGPWQVHSGKDFNTDLELDVRINGNKLPILVASQETFEITVTATNRSSQPIEKFWTGITFGILDP